MHMTEQVPSHRHIALYCRVSTEEQAQQGVSLDEQQERLRSYCRAMAWKEDTVLYIDDGYSAKNTNRPQLTELLHAVQKKEVSKIMVTKLDRMSRKLLDLLTLIEMFQEHDASFISVGEAFDTTTAPGRLTLQVLGAVAEFERERIRERVVENMMHAAHKGKWLTQHPYGYRLENKELVIYEPEAKVVQTIFQLYVEKNMGFYAIAKYLNNEGIVSRYKKEWSIRSVKLLLQNPVYKGTFVWNRRDGSKKNREKKSQEEWIVLEDTLPAIVDKECWEKAQKPKRSANVAPRARTSPHLLGGLVKCGKCGSGLSIGWSGSPNNRYRVYRCSANKNKGTCTSKQYRAETIEALFKEHFSALCESFQLQLIPIVSLGPKIENNDKKKITQAQERYKRKVEAYTAGLIELEDLHEEKQRLESIKASISTPSHNTIQQEELEKWIKKRLTGVLDALDRLPVEQAKVLLQQVIEKVIVHEEQELTIVLQPIV